MHTVFTLCVCNGCAFVNVGIECVRIEVKRECARVRERANMEQVSAR
jgi:hypothetical protein